jgi:hypothetical protein
VLTAEAPRTKLLDDILAMMAEAAQSAGNVTCLELVELE